MAEKQPHSDEVKGAVMAALLAGQSISSVAKEYKIPKGTVHGWQRQAETLTRSGGVGGVATEKQGRIGDLLFEYLIASLMSLKVQAEHFGDKKWLERQSADSLAILHGVTVDKAVRLLEALTSGDASNAATASGDEEMQG